MLEVDGGQKSGSGTILRLAVAVAGILGEPLHMYNIRKKRSNPGLRPQHLESLLTAAKLCSAEVKGATVGSKEIWFYPQEISGGPYTAEIGTAGSIPMLIMTVLPICAFARKDVELRILKGGTDAAHSPTINYLLNVFLPHLKLMGLNAEINVIKYGYYPKGMGEVTLRVTPCRQLRPIRIEKFGEVTEIGGVSVCTFLEERRVAERQMVAAKELLKKHGYIPKITVINDRSNPLQKGSSITLWAKTSEGCLLGSDAIGELRKRSEVVGKEAAEKLLVELEAEATVDIHMADMLIPYVALAKGCSVFKVRDLTDHMNTNIWLMETLLGSKFKLSRENSLIRVEKTE